MDKNKLILVLSFSLFLFGSFSDSFDIKRVEGVMNEYMTLMQDYSNLPPASDAVEKKGELISLFDLNAIAGYEYASDLFKPEECDAPSLNSYLDYITKNYQNKIVVSFTKPYYFKCLRKIGTKEFAIVSVDKSLEYLGQKSNNKKLIIGIDVSDYKINMVAFPENLQKDNNCVIDQKQDEQNDLFNENSNNGDRLLINKDFIGAKNFYEKALNYKPNDNHVLSQLNKCNDILNYNSYKTEAENNFLNKKFNKAKDLFLKIVSKYPINKEYAEKKIKECDEGIRIENYELYKQFGDDYFKKEYYTLASQNYQSSLKYNPNDSYLLGMIKKCDNSTPTKVNEAISKAIYLAEKQHKLAEAFQMLSYYEGSGMLKGDNYYFMAMMMDGRDDNVDKLMKYSKKQCYQLAQEYCVKGIRRGDKKCVDMWNNILKIK